MVILTPLPQKSPNLFMTKHHYVYRSFEEEGREYIGIRSCNCLPEEDTKYFGSFRDKTFKPTGKTILFVRETRQEVVEIEIELHNFFDVAVNPQFANQAKQTSKGFDRTGVPNTEAQKKANSERMSGENNPMYGVTRTKEWKKAHSERMSGENHPLYGLPNTEEQKRKNSVAKSGENNPQYGKTGAAHNNSKAIIAIKPDGTEEHYGSIIDAVRDTELGISAGHLKKLLKTGKSPRWGKFRGWQFLYKNSEDV